MPTSVNGHCTPFEMLVDAGWKPWPLDATAATFSVKVRKAATTFSLLLLLPWGRHGSCGWECTHVLFANVEVYAYPIYLSNPINLECWIVL